MATAKPKRMMFGGVAKGAMNSVKKAVAAKPAVSGLKQIVPSQRAQQQQAAKNMAQVRALPSAQRAQYDAQKQRAALPPGLTKNPSAPTQSQMQAAAKQQAGARQVPSYAKPYVAAQGKSPIPSQGQLPSKLAGVAKAFSQQKSGATGTGSQRVMKKGGAVKKKATKK
jgi:hypothetical protein